MTTSRPGFFAAAQTPRYLIGVVLPGAHRYWRLFVPSTQNTGSGANDDFSVAELAMREFIQGPNVASGQTYAASSEFDVANNADKAFDSNTGTQLVTTDNTNAWVSVDFGLGNDIEIHEIVYTSRANFSRQQPAVIRVEYSDDNSAWFPAFIVTPDTWPDTQEVRTYTPEYAQAQYATTPYQTPFLSVNLTCAGAWGTLLRNHGYTGPAMTVEDNANPGTTTDVFFDGAGLLRGASPYGTDTRVITLYDQFGSTDLFATAADNITIRVNDSEYSTWLMDFQSGALTSTAVTDGGQAWEVGDMIWACGTRRINGTSLKLIWGVAASSGFMEVGVWQDSADFHWRINGSSSADWTGTDWVLNASDVRNGKIERLIGDYATTVGTAQAWRNNVAAGTRTFTAPIAYTTGEPLNIGGGINGNYDGYVSELAIFDPSGTLSTEDRVVIDDALAQADFFVTDDTTIVQEQRMHVILGHKIGNVSVHTQNAFAIVGGFPGLSTRGHTLYTVMAPPIDRINVRAQRLHAIIIP